MVEAMIQAGRLSDLSSVNPLIILDIGFSASKKTCGLLFDDDQAAAVTFGDAVGKIIDRLRTEKHGTNFIIEAPLSVCFSSDGNPAFRSIERENKQSRPWYSGAGAAVTLSVLYLFQKIQKANLDSDLRLFEALISFKEKGKKSDHKNEVSALRDVIRDTNRLSQRWIEPDRLKQNETDELQSVFKIVGIDAGIPPVIKLDSSDLKRDF